MTTPRVTEVTRGSSHPANPATHPSRSRLHLVPDESAPPASQGSRIPTGNPVLLKAVNLAIWSRWISAAIRVSQQS